jgi:hypothetical protein
MGNQVTNVTRIQDYSLFSFEFISVFVMCFRVLFVLLCATSPFPYHNVSDS